MKVVRTHDGKSKTIATGLSEIDAVQLMVDKANKEMRSVPNDAKIHIAGPRSIAICIGVYKITTFEAIS